MKENITQMEKYAFGAINENKILLNRKIYSFNISIVFYKYFIMCEKIFRSGSHKYEYAYIYHKIQSYD